MTADPLAGLVLAGFDGLQASDPGVQALLELGVGGFVVFGRNVESPHQVHDLLSGIRAACTDRPLLFAVDQEGGRVARLRAPLTEWPPMEKLAQADDLELAREVGRALALEIGAVGFNLVLAPVLDVRFEGTTIAIGDRSLGRDPQRVAQLGTALIQGIQSAGLLACGKHFPGHGHVTVDSHVELPVCPLGEEGLEAHIEPFAAAVRGGVDSIMTAHVVYPALDGDAPATLSSACIDQLLRKRLDFRGVVLSDDMEMGAISKHHGVGEACVQAVRAGVDGLLVCHGLDAVQDTIAQLRAEANRDLDFLARCVESLARLEIAAKRCPPRARPRGELDASIGSAEHARLAARIGEAAPRGVDPTAYVPS